MYRAVPITLRLQSRAIYTTGLALVKAVSAKANNVNTQSPGLKARGYD